MKILLSLFLLFFSSNLFAECTGEDCKSMTATIPLYSQKISIAIGADLKAAYQGPPGNVFILEFVPKDETVNAWTKMLAINAFKGLSERISLTKAYELEAESVRRACPENFVSEKLDYKLPQNFESLSVIMGCKSSPMLPPNTSEMGAYIFVKGKNDHYFIKKSYRGSADKIALNSESVKVLAPEIFSLKMCKNDGQSPVCEPE